MSWTIDRQSHLSNLMIAYKLGDLSVYLRELESVEKWLDKEMYNFFYNLSKSSLFTKKGYFKK